MLPVLRRLPVCAAHAHPVPTVPTTICKRRARSLQSRNRSLAGCASRAISTLRDPSKQARDSIAEEAGKIAGQDTPEKGEATPRDIRDNTKPQKKEKADKRTQSSLAGFQTRPNESRKIIFSTYPNTASGADSTHARKVHILGIDEKAKFLGHVLRSSYERVEFLSPQGPNKYTNIVYGPGTPPVPNRAFADPRGESDPNEPITDLVMVESSIEALEKVKNRIDDRSTVCVVQEGLGLAEQANDEIFSSLKSRPAILLGHMPRSYRYDRSTMSVRQMPRNLSHKSTYLTRAASGDGNTGGNSTPPSTAGKSINHLVHSFQSSNQLKGRVLPFDHWLRMKLPSMVFSSVVEPVCTTLNCRYDQIMDNRRGMRMVDQLLREITTVVLNLPEIQGSADILGAFEGEQIRKHCLGQIRGKGNAPSIMAQRVRQGKWTDIDYLNGWFVKKGDQLGIELSANKLAVSIVKAKMYQRRKILHSYIPWEETSLR